MNSTVAGMSVRFLSDQQLLRSCRLDQHRGSGPGGQKRNKTSNAVRLTHTPSGIAVTASESRSLLENKTRALRRMRIKLAVDLREPLDPVKFEPPDWFLSMRRGDRIEASHRHEFYVPLVGLVMDLMDAMNGNPSAVATMLGVSTTSIVKILEAEPQLWTAANRTRTGAGMKPLTHRR
jgi:RF-1 domain